MSEVTNIANRSILISHESYTVKVRHLRRFKNTSKTGPRNVFMSYSDCLQKGIDWSTMEPTGGITQVSLINSSGECASFAEAVCSKADNYNKKRGVQIAIGRALKNWYA